jgi:CelD/BcsL family acetyltransferase involved in cellulose biosynthesis
MSKMISITVYESFTPELMVIWDGVSEKNPQHPFQSYSWLNHWYSKVGKPLENVIPQIVVLSSGNTTIAILPFGVRKKYSCSILEWLGGEQTDYLGPVYNPEHLEHIDLNNDLWMEIDKHLVPYDIAHLKKQVNGNKIFTALNGPGNTLVSWGYTSLTTLSDNWEAHLYDRVKKKIRSDTRRQEKRLNELGELKYFSTVEVAGTEEIVKTMIRQKRQRYLNTGVWDMLAIPENESFYLDLINISDNQYKVHYSSAQVGKEIIATHVGLVSNDTFYYLMPAHEQGEWERFSPGRLLLQYLLKYSIEKRLKFFDFTIGGESYKNNWCDDGVQLFELYRKKTIKGQAYYTVQRLKEKVKSSVFSDNLFRFALNWVRHLNTVNRRDVGK